MPTRKMRPAAHTHTSVVASTRTMPAAISHHGTPGGTDSRATSSIGVANGKKEQTRAIGPLGSCMMGTSAKKGMHAINMIGVNSACVSLMSDAAAPMAMKSEPNSKRAMSNIGKNQGINFIGTMSDMPKYA